MHLFCQLTLVNGSLFNRLASFLLQLQLLLSFYDQWLVSDYFLFFTRIFNCATAKFCQSKGLLCVSRFDLFTSWKKSNWNIQKIWMLPWIETLSVHEVKGKKVFFLFSITLFFCYTVWKYNTGNNGKTSILMAAVIRVAELQSYAEL